MAKKEPEPETENITKFGWCMDAYHETCVKEFFSDMTKKTYQCFCPCHTKESGPG